MGGTTGIGFALEHPERLKSLTLVSSAAAGYSIGKKISSLDRTAREKGVEAAKKRWMRMTLSYYNEDQAEIAKLMTEMVNDHTGAIWLDPMRGQYDREDDMARVNQIEMPVLLMCGQADKVFHEVGELLHERIQESKFISYPNVGHMVNLEIPTPFNGDLKLFLEALG
jgi:2-succinyl-6-hydroxy-2,4-cyclohexadiene-1-carboxylate synthase